MLLRLFLSFQYFIMAFVPPVNRPEAFKRDFPAWMFPLFMIPLILTLAYIFFQVNLFSDIWTALKWVIFGKEVTPEEKREFFCVISNALRDARLALKEKRYDDWGAANALERAADILKQQGVVRRALGGDLKKISTCLNYLRDALRKGAPFNEKFNGVVDQCMRSLDKQISKYQPRV